MLLDKQLSVSGNESEETTAEDRWYSHALTLRRGGSITLVEPLGEGTIRLDIEPEQVWRNINKLNEEDWERIFQAIGLPEDYWPELIDSYFDWIDPDSIPRQDGAESSDYYETLDPPYQARNAPFDTIRELLLVKGFKEAIISRRLEPGRAYECRSPSPTGYRTCLPSLVMARSTSTPCGRITSRC